VWVIPYQILVNSTNDSGPGTLRQAILDANESPGENLIVFDFPGAAPHKILLSTALPEITSPLIIDGNSSNSVPSPKWRQPGRDWYGSHWATPESTG